MSEGFLFDISIVKSLKSFDDATYRKMMNAVIQYCFDGTEPELEGIEEGLFESWKATLDLLNKDRKNGKKGGRPTKKEVENTEEKTPLKPPFNPLLTPLKEGKNPVLQEKEESEKERSKEKEKEEKDIDIYIYAESEKTAKQKREEQAEELFESLWQMYPRKGNKSSVSKTTKLELLKVGYDRMSLAVKRYSQEVEGKEEQYILKGGRFFNGLYKDYLEPDVPAIVPKVMPKEPEINPNLGLDKCVEVNEDGSNWDEYCSDKAAHPPDEGWRVNDDGYWYRT